MIMDHDNDSFTATSLEKERDHVVANIKTNAYSFSKYGNFKNLLEGYKEQLCQRILINNHIHGLKRSRTLSPPPPPPKDFWKWNQLIQISDRITFSVMNFLSVRDLVSLISTSHRKKALLAFTEDDRAIDVLVETPYPAIALTSAIRTYKHRSLQSLVWVFQRAELPGPCHPHTAAQTHLAGARTRAPPVDAWVLCELCKSKDLKIGSKTVSLDSLCTWYLKQRKFSDICHILHEARKGRTGSGSGDGDGNGNGNDNTVATETIFNLCARYGNHALLERLLSAACSQEEKIARNNVLSHAIEHNVLTPFGYTPNAIFSVRGFTALHFASLAGHIDVVRVLLTHGVSTLLQTRPQDECLDVPSPLMLASLGGHLSLVRLMLNNIQQLASTQEQLHELHCSTAGRGLTALHFAVIGVTAANKVSTALSHPTDHYNSLDIIRDLLIADERIMQTSDRRMNPVALHSHQDCNGNTALHIACENGEIRAVRALLPGMDTASIFSTVNHDKLNAMQTAKRGKHEDILNEITGHINMLQSRRPSGAAAATPTSAVAYHHYVKTEKR